MIQIDILALTHSTEGLRHFGHFFINLYGVLATYFFIVWFEHVLYIGFDLILAIVLQFICIEILIEFFLNIQIKIKAANVLIDNLTDHCLFLQLCLLGLCLRLDWIIATKRRAAFFLARRLQVIHVLLILIQVQSYKFLNELFLASTEFNTTEPCSFHIKFTSLRVVVHELNQHIPF